MSVSQHRHYDAQNKQNQKNEMSEDPRDGSRGTDKLKTGPGAGNVSPEAKEQHDPEKLEEFGARGATTAAKD